MASSTIIEAVAGASAVLLDYRPLSKSNQITEVAAAFGSLGIRMNSDNVIVYDRFQPGDFQERLRQRLASTGASRAVVDISTMSKLAIMLELHVCRDLGLDTLVLYAEAREYGPKEAEFQQAKTDNAIHRPTLQVFTGVHGVVRVDSLASVAMQGHPTAAIAFMSFNNTLTQVLLNTVYPSRLLLANGRPPKHSWREEATAWIHDQVRREWEADNPLDEGDASRGPLPKRVVSTLDYRETLALILSIYWRLSSTHRILLAPAASKMGAVGCYLAKALHPDIHIEYPSPDGFLPEYSAGVGDVWSVELGPLEKKLTKISAAERRQYLEIRTQAQES